MLEDASDSGDEQPVKHACQLLNKAHHLGARELRRSEHRLPDRCGQPNQPCAVKKTDGSLHKSYEGEERIATQTTATALPRHPQPQVAVAGGLAKPAAETLGNGIRKIGISKKGGPHPRGPPTHLACPARPTAP